MLNLNMLINKMQKMDEQSLESPLPKSLPGALRIPPGCASAVFRIRLLYQQKYWWVLPPTDLSFNAQALSLHKGWSKAKLALQQNV